MEILSSDPLPMFSFTAQIVQATEILGQHDLEVRLDEHDRATELLLELQAPRLHSRCPNTRNPPGPCATCEEVMGDEYAVWRLLMIVNRKW